MFLVVRVVISVVVFLVVQLAMLADDAAIVVVVVVVLMTETMQNRFPLHSVLNSLKVPLPPVLEPGLLR